MGNGSNILVSDAGFNGLVTRIKDQELRIKDEKIYAGAGAVISKIVNESVIGGLTGLEWAIGIPGTLGGAIYGNAGAFGHSISESVESVEVFNAKDLTSVTLTNSECKFDYRNSIFQPKADQPMADKEKRYVILKATLKLAKGDVKKSREQIKEYLKKRQGRHPIGPSAGSVFKNPSINENQKAFQKILLRFPEAEKFKTTGKIPAGWLIEELGLLGKRIGGAMISKEHGNFIINVGNAKATDVIMLVSIIKQKVRVNFGIQLQEEIQYVGF